MEAVYISAQQYLVIIICKNMMNTWMDYLGLSIFMYYTFQEGSQGDFTNLFQISVGLST